MATEARELSRDGRQDTLARRPGKGQRAKPNFEDLEDAYRELELYKKEEEKQKKEAEKERKSQLAAEKKLMNRALQQAQKQVNSTQKAVNGILRQLDKVEQDVNKKTGLKALQEGKREEMLKKLREDQHHVEVQLNTKRADVGESKGRLECIERTLRQLGGEDISVEADVSTGSAIAEDPQMEAEIEEQGRLRELADDIRVRNDELADENQQLRLELEDALRTAEGRRASKEQAAADRRNARREQRLQARQAREEARERRRSESRRQRLDEKAKLAQDMASALGKRPFDDPSNGADGVFRALGQPGTLLPPGALLERSRSCSRPLSVRSYDGKCATNGMASPQALRITPLQQTSTTRLPVRSLSPARRPVTPMESTSYSLAASPVTPGNCQRGRSPRGMLHSCASQPLTSRGAPTPVPMSAACTAGSLPVWAMSFTGNQALSARSRSGGPPLGSLSCPNTARPAPTVYTAPGPRPPDGGYGALGSRTPSGPLPQVIGGGLAVPAPILGGAPLGTPPMAQLAPWPCAGSAGPLSGGCGCLSVTASLARPMSYPSLATTMPRMQAPAPPRPSPAPQMEPVAQPAGPLPGGGWRGGKRGSITDVLFDAIDVDHDGCITRDELRTALRSEVVTAI